MKKLFILFFIPSLFYAMESQEAEAPNLKDIATSLLKEELHGYAPDSVVEAGKVILGYSALCQAGCDVGSTVLLNGPYNVGKI